MALFFDAAWFDARLNAAGLSHAALAAALGLTEEQRAELWKDQRELSADDVRLLAALLAVPAAEVAHHAGIATPVPRETERDAMAARLDAMEARLGDIEKTLAEIRGALFAMTVKR
jgi:transcriptional regulator with XRE-family HTH domain